MVLWCLALSSRSRPVFAAASSFAVSILSEDQHHLVSLLSRPGNERLNGVAVRDGFDGAPVIQAAAAAFECTLVSVTPAGDHELYLGQVETFERQEGAPLAYLGGQYGRVHLAA